MDDIPRALLEGLSLGAVAEAKAWWCNLTEAARQEITFLWDERQDLCFFPPERDDSGKWRWVRTPKVIGGRFVPPDEEPSWAEWYAEHFEYLVCHPELVFFEPPVWRTFHICTAHEAARTVLATGKLPTDFRCPLRSLACPIRELLGRVPQSDAATSNCQRTSNVNSGSP